MDETKFTPYYQEIANLLNDFMPVDWYDIALYTEVEENISAAAFYFRTEEGGDYLESGKIPKLYQMDKMVYVNLIGELLKVIYGLKKEFIKQDLPTWCVFTFILDKSFNFKVGVEYVIDEEISSFLRKAYWAYRKLGVVPEDASKKKTLYEYLVRRK